MVRSAHEMHTYLIDQVNNMLRRLGMFGGEPALWTLFDHLFYLEGEDHGVADIYESWRDRNAFTPTGAQGALGRLLPDNLRSALPSMYAEAARNRGWLRLDRTLTPDEYARLRASIEPFAEQDHTWSDVVDAFGQPSVLFGGTNPRYEKTLAYATADKSDPMVIFHLWNGVDSDTQAPWPPMYTDPILLAIRCGSGPFVDSFVFTPEGNRRRPPMNGID
ncbi:hypothetical protein [Nocardia barduliensis]|uniref:hypothetical protein n=1 Tax=Nocardia barduliensis TaxID=2736643 RepID=UPI001574E871|nr:hypothetical protein [Nocardia barduliensis]